jgi:hypothetical protein
MSREAVLATVLWVLHTWTLDAFSTAPILNVTSPAKRCGKTRLLEILGMLVKRPLAASNITAAAVFRSIDKWAPTLLVDEADTFLPKNDELRGVLNSSHYRSGAFVVRVVGEQLEPKQFSTWCAKAIAGIGKLGADTLEDRSIRIPLSRKSKGESVSRLVHAEAESRIRRRSGGSSLGGASITSRISGNGWDEATLPPISTIDNRTTGVPCSRLRISAVFGTRRGRWRSPSAPIGTMTRRPSFCSRT